MYAGTFVFLLLPAVAYWGSLVVACAGHDRRFVGVGSYGRVGRRWEARGWEKVVRTLREGHREEWWTPEVEPGPYGGACIRRC